VSTEPNTEFGPYKLLTMLGKGGMGEVWRAYDTDTDRVVALKLLPSGLAGDDGYRERFLREAQIVSKLNNPFIVPIHRYGTIDDRLYVDMRLVEGRDLATLLENGPLPPARAVAIVEQIAKALNAAHRLGLVHRDVKPSNVLVTDDDFAYLIDFGIAQDVNRTGLTGTGTVIGTWTYMAPERMTRVDASGPSCDVYSLACVLHECLTATKPFPGDSVEIQVAAHLHAPPPRPSQTTPTVPPSFDPVVDRGMAKDPRARYATTLDLATAAKSALTAGPFAPPSAPTLAAPPVPPTQWSTAPPAYAAPPPQTWPPTGPPAPPPARGSRTRLFAGLGIGLAVVIAAVVVGVVALTGRDDAGSGTTTSARGSTTTSTSAGVQPSTSSGPPGDPVKVGDLLVTVTGTEIVPSFPAVTPLNGEFFVVHMTVRNDGPGSVTLMSSVQHLIAGDMTYSGSAAISTYLEKIILPTVAPGQEQEWSVGFDVPTTVTPEAIEFDDDFVDGGGVRVPLP
jgi:serine/threonine protein kinase